MPTQEDVLKVTEGDDEYFDVALKAVRADPTKNTWSVTLEDEGGANGCSLFVYADGSVDHGDRALPAPEPFDTLRLWGKNANSLGGLVRGIALLSSEREGESLVTKVHTIYRYRTREQQEEQDRAWVDENVAKKKAKWEDKRDETAARIAALPEPFRERIEFFMRQPDWGWDFGFYELFCCEEAAKIAKALKTGEKIEAFSEMKSARQREVVPELLRGSLGQHVRRGRPPRAQLRDEAAVSFSGARRDVPSGRMQELRVLVHDARRAHQGRRAHRHVERLMPVYQLVVSGPDKIGGNPRKCYSKRLFRTREAADAEMDAFCTRCCGNGIWDLDSVDQRKVLELELDAEDMSAVRKGASEKPVAEMQPLERALVGLTWARAQLDEGNVESAKNIVAQALADLGLS